MLVPHGDAVLRHHRAVFASALYEAKTARQFRQRQLQAYDGLTTLPLTAWSYRVDSVVDSADAQAAARAKWGPSALIVHLVLTYALRGVDAIPTHRDLWWTFVRHDGRIQIAADDDLADAGGVSWRGPWDYGPIQVVRGRSSLVVGHPAQAAQLRLIAAAVDRAVPTVSAIWGNDWSRDVAVFVPAGRDELVSLLGPNTTTTAPVAALARTDGQDPATGRPYGQRLVADPSVFARLSPVGLTVVVTHEVTHIAAGAATSDFIPQWLVEGFAEYVGNRAGGQPVDVVAAELRADVRAGRVPAALPTDTDFMTAAPQAYEGAWLACRLIADRIGPAGLVRFYRAVGAAPAVGADAVDGPLRTLLRLTPAQFVAAWRRYVVAELR